jgi:hypothetical protein
MWSLLDRRPEILFDNPQWARKCSTSQPLWSERVSLLDMHVRSSDDSQSTDDMPGPAGLALLSLVPAADRATVLVAARRLCVGGVHDGLSIGSYDLGMVAVTVAAMAPTLTADRLRLLFMYCCATIELDDRLDSQPLEQAQRAADRIGELIRSGALAADADHFEAALLSILDQLRAEDAGAGTFGRLMAALADAAAAGASLTRLSRLVAQGSAPLPSAGEYLEVASRDVNFRSVALALVILCAERRSPAQVDRLDQAITVACRTVRLANDHATAAKDRAERRLNIIGLSADGLGALSLSADGLGAPVTADDVERWIDHNVQTHAALLAAASSPGLATTTAALANSLRMAVGLYRLASRYQGGPAHGVRHQQGAARQ